MLLMQGHLTGTSPVWRSKLIGKTIKRLQNDYKCQVSNSYMALKLGEQLKKHLKKHPDFCKCLRTILQIYWPDTI